MRLAVQPSAIGPQRRTTGIERRKLKFDEAAQTGVDIGSVS